MGLHGNSRALVELSDDFEEAFLSLDIPRTFVYGEQTYPGNTGEVTADAPDSEKLAKRGVSISVVPDTGHNLMLGNNHASPHPKGELAITGLRVVQRVFGNHVCSVNQAVIGHRL